MNMNILLVHKEIKT